jgi:ferritin-like metal-binding protein YciE
LPAPEPDEAVAWRAAGEPDIAWAEELGHDDIVRFLTTNLNEEKAADTKLNGIALRKGVNRRAAS